MLRLERIETIRLDHLGFCWKAAVDDTTIYLSDAEASIWAIDPATLDERWSIPADLFQIEGLSGGTLLTQSNATSRVRALDAATGRIRWEAGAGWGTVYPWRGGAFIESEDRTAFTVRRLTDGRIVERGHFPSAPWFMLEAFAIIADPRRGVLRAVEPGSRRAVWELSLPCIVGADVVVASRRHALAILRHRGALHALDLAAGKYLWAAKQPVGTRRGQVVGGRILLPYADGLVCLDAVTGERQWSQPLGRYGGIERILDYGPYFLTVKGLETLVVASLESGAVEGRYSLPKSFGPTQGIMTWKDLVLLVLEHGRVHFLTPAAKRRSTGRPKATPRRPRVIPVIQNGRPGGVVRGTAGEPQLVPLHTIRARDQSIGPWLATDAGLVVSDGRLARGGHLHLRAEILTLYRSTGTALAPQLERRCHWTPRLLCKGTLILLDSSADKVGACSLSDGEQLWTASSDEGTVWQVAGKVVVKRPRRAEVEILHPGDGKILDRLALPRPHLLGLFGSVLVCSDVWPKDCELLAKAGSSVARGTFVGIDVRTGQTLWEHGTDPWFGADVESGEILCYHPDPLDPPGDFPALLMLRSHRSARWTYRALSPHNLRARWATRLVGVTPQWEPALNAFVFWGSSPAPRKTVELLDIASGRIERLATHQPQTRWRGIHWDWGRYLGTHGGGLLFQGAKRCVDVVDRMTHRTRHYLLPRPEEVKEAGSWDGRLLLRREKAIDIVDAAHL